jgi:hypothetical protein
MIFCAACAYWSRWRETEGVCRRHAPEPSPRSGAVSHWPQTHDWQGCGEGDSAIEGHPVRRCDGCLYWRRPKDGLDPVDRADMRKGWWATAGLCTRYAPHPVADPGPRAFWRATQENDFCGEWRRR